MSDTTRQHKNQPLRWGIIGCGNVTEVKSGPAYQQTEGFELYAVMRRDLAKAKDYAQRHGVPMFSNDADELIFNDTIDAIYIATPPDSHLHYALKVAEAGKICCIEKPMAPRYQDCQRIVAAFQEIKLPLFVAYYRRSLARFKQVKDWLEQQQIGTVRHVSWQLYKPVNERDLSANYNWRTDPAIALGGYFDDLASHGLDLIAYLLGPCIDVKGIASQQQGLYQAKDALSACWLHEGNITGSGSWNFGAGQAYDELMIIGQQGSIRFSVFEEQPLVLERNGQRQEVRIDHPPHIQQPHVEAMRDHLWGRSTHPSTGQSATHTAWIMDKILGRL